MRYCIKTFLDNTCICSTLTLHLNLHLSSSIDLFRHNCLLTDLACLHMTCYNHNGHAVRTGLQNLSSMFFREFSVGASTIPVGSLFHVFAALSRRKYFLTRRLDLGFAILWFCPLVLFGDCSRLMYGVSFVYIPDTCL